jgi:L-threonylcarbamoyladenylate synthase
MRRTLTLKVDPKRPDLALVAYAAAGVRGGKLIAFPTETVYGIAANMLDKKAIDRLYAVKKRPKTKPFTVHIAREDQIAEAGCRLTKEAKLLTGRFWPGPLTILLKSKRGGKVGFRIPRNPVALCLIASSGVPVVAPSANLSGRSAPSNAREVLKQLDGRIDMVLDGGKTEVGIESTVVDCSVTPPVIVRQGAISREKLKKLIDIS